MRDPCDICERKACFLFKYCDSKWYDKLNRHKECIRFSAGQQFIHEHGTAYGVYFIQSGKVKVYKKALQAKSQVVRLATSGDILGYEAFRAESHYPVSAVTLTESLVCFIPAELYLNLLKHNPEMNIKVMYQYADELKRIETMIRNMALMTVREKVADAILMVSETGITKDSALDEALTRKDIAEIAGTNAEQVSRYITEFKREGILETEGKKIYLLKPKLLKNLLKHFTP